jgi:hypothetical protein
VNQFVQTPCPKCGAVVWIAPALGTGFCPSCHTQTSLPQGAAAAPAAPAYGAPAAPAYGAPAAPAYGAPAAPAYGVPTAPAAPGYGVPAAPPQVAPFGAPGMQPVMPGGGAFGAMNKTAATMRFMRLGISIVVVLGVAAVGISTAGWRYFVGAPGSASLSSLGIDKKKADPDRMISAAQSYARKWKSDAAFWSINIQQLGADGTVDLSNSNVVVEYYSPSGVSSPSKSARDDSIKKFNYIGDSVQYGAKWGVTKRSDPAPSPTPVPTCTAKLLAARLVSLGILKSGSTVHAQIDPAFDDEWLVQTGGGPRKFDLSNCNERK